MRIAVLVLVVLLAFTRYQVMFAQSTSLKGTTVEAVKKEFIHQLRTTFADSAIVVPMSEYIESEMSNIHQGIQLDANLSVIERDKAMRSLVYFMKELNVHLHRRTIDIYAIPGAIHSYKKLLNSVLNDKPIGTILEGSGTHRSQLLASSFSQYQQYALLDDIAVYKRVASSPEFILQFLERKPGFRFSDSLLAMAAAADPLRIVYYLNEPGSGVQEKIRSTGNIYLREISAISKHKSAPELLPFVTQIAERTMTVEEVLALRMQPTLYFKQMVNTLQSAVAGGDANMLFLKPLRNGIRQKGVSFYVNELNDRHDEAEAARFSSVKELRPQDLYYIITSCGEELYTSSFLGLYKRMMIPFATQPADSLLDLVHYDNFRVFTRLAANYNVLDDFLHRLSPGKMNELLAKFITGIEVNEQAALEKAMDIADAIASLPPGSEGSERIEAELLSNLERSRQTQHYLGMRLYSILLDINNQVKKKDGLSKLWETLGDYEVLTQQALRNKNGEIVQLVLFYGDEDGVNSYGNFIRMFGDKSKWEVKKNDQWVSIRSTGPQPLMLYANLPLDIKEERDSRAQDSLVAYLKSQSIEPSILIHRGHSYHLDKTMNRLTPAVKLAILGSCGGYNKAISIASINPDVQVIGSKKTGAGAINDPIIDEINTTLLGGKDIHWPQAWDNLTARFSKDGRLGLFNEYFPPSNNLGLFVLKLYKYYNRSL